MAQNPTVQNGVATYHSNKNIGRKFRVPDSWDKIVIKANVTLTGSFYMPTRNHPIEIAGESRVTSIIKGDGSRPTNDGINGRSYSAIRCDKSPNLYVHDLRSLNPMKFHIHGGFGHVTVERCDLIENRETHTTDGVHGGHGKTIVRDCYINTYDDALYTIECKLVENTTIVHNKNGGPFMTSWGASVPNNHVCVIRNCKVIDNYNGTNYNHGVVSWAGKNSGGSQTITLKFEGTFEYEVNPGKKSSTMYTIGRPNNGGVNNAHIVIDGICARRNSVDTRRSTNSSVTFKNCNSNPCEGNVLPSVSLTGPTNGSVFDTSDNITFSANASDSDGSVSSVSFYANGQLLGTDNNSPYRITKQLSSGNYTITAVAVDNCGASKNSAGRNITVSSTVPTPLSKIEAENFSAQYGIQTQATGDVGGG
ncbi:MAG: Ig-like domain-containing protein, partial [Bacteroidales bacterium]|nr:Ig-like domain-containing protein [Bacteroidales bacterium]